MKNIIRKWLGIDELKNKLSQLKKEVTRQGKKIHSTNERVRTNQTNINKLH